MTADAAARLRGNLYLVLSTFAWASAFPATATLLSTWHPLLVATARIGGGALVLLLLLVVTGRIRRVGRLQPWRIIGLGTVGFAGGAGLIVAGQQFADPVTAAVIATSIPLISAAMGLLERTERMSVRLALGILLAVAGGIVVSLAPLDGRPGFEGGELLVLGSQICWAWFSRRALTAFADLDPIARAGLPMAAGALVLGGLTGALVLAGVIEPRYELSLESVGLIAWIAVMGIGLAVLLWLVASQILGVTVAAMHVNLGPFYVMLIALAAGGSILVGQVVGALLVAAGALVAQLGRHEPRRRSGLPEASQGD